MRQFAHIYQKLGLNTLPTKKDKSPALTTWKHLVTQLISLNEITQNFTEQTGIGIICGKISGNLEVLDVDNHQGTAKENLSELAKIPEVKEIIEKYEFPLQLTQGGGYHLFYRCENISGSQKIASVPIFDEKTNKYKPDAIFETKGEGGYVVAAPTTGYKFIKGDLNKIPEISEKERDIILNGARSFNVWITPTKKINIESTGERLGDKYNEDENNVYEIKSLLKENGWQEINNTLWRREGKIHGISATFGKVAKNVFYNFSANGYPFEPNRAYNLFSIYAILKFNSDFKEAAKSLIYKYGEVVKVEKYEKKETTKTDVSPTEIKSILESRKIDKNKKYEPPIPILSIRKSYDIDDNFYIEQPFVRLMTEGNISVVTGKAKSKKTFLQTLFASALISDSFSELLKHNLKKPKIIYLDTEQSTFDVYMITDRIKKLTFNSIDYLDVYNLRGLDHNQNLSLLEYICENEHKNISVIFIDQVADFLRSVNNEEESVRVVKLLESLSFKYKLHFSCVVHQNKLTDFATGWLGTMLMKKAETIIKVTSDIADKKISIVEPDMMRGEEFEPFRFYINQLGLPEILKYAKQAIKPTREMPF